MSSNVKNATLKYDNCIGCGICMSSCPNEAIKMGLSKNMEINPNIDLDRCNMCGICTEYCPHSQDKILFEAQKISKAADPNSFGLEGAVYLLAHDKDEDNRRRSASGGILTSLIKHLFEEKKIDGVIHASMISGAVGELHYEASISFSFEEADKKRSSFYGQIDYSGILNKLKHEEKTYLLIGVPCAIRALTKLFNEYKLYNKNKIYTVALSCSHNVNGQFIDFLAESVEIPKNVPFKVNLRNKDNIKDANNFNNHFFSGTRDIVKINRFQSIFTDTWRNYFFSMKVCNYCSDFWGYTADVSVKDAWGKWAENPLGDSIVICRNQELLNEILNSKNIEYEYLGFDTVANSQSATTEYKQVKIMDRLNKPAWQTDNIRSGFLKYTVLSGLSKFCYRNLGYMLSKRILFFLLGVLKKIEKKARDRENIGSFSKKALIKYIVKKADKKRVVFFGTGEMAKKLKEAVPLQIEYYVDNDGKKQNILIDNVPVKNPSQLLYESKNEIYVIVASTYYDQISAQLKKMGFIEGTQFIDGRLVYERVIGQEDHIKAANFLKPVTKTFGPFFVILNKLKKIFIYRKTKKYKKILVVGGYGYKNTGDEAQLSANIKLLKDEFPDYMIKVLTPNQHYTYFEHGECAVGDAPRAAFYDAGETSLYSLDNLWKKLIFIFISLLVYLNAFLVRAGLPVFLINAKKAALLYDIYTSDMVYFSGGGYLTGKTVSRLWDGMFLIRIADVFKVPSFLSGQTIGVWKSSFNKRLAKWGFSEAKLITLRDPLESIGALKEIGLSGEHIFTTFDDALFCEKIEDEDKIDKILSDSGLSTDDLKNGFVTLNIHYWGIAGMQEKNQLLRKINSIISVILEKTKHNVLLIPMTPSDEDTINDYKLQYSNDRVCSLLYDYNFRVVRSIIGRSCLCITMKHHPIIFAVGEMVPVISLALGDYYEHKNIGALRIFGLEKFNILLQEKSFLQDFSNLLDIACENRDKLIGDMEIKFRELKSKKAFFISQLRNELS